MRYPDFFVVGAAKCGTTSLVNMLKQHPDIFIPNFKEPFYYTTGFGVDNVEEYVSLYEGVSKSHMCGDATTAYLFERESAIKIKSDVPNAYIIILLRNPSDMAYSFWQYNTTHGCENLPFIDAISEHARAYRKSDKFKDECSDWWCNYLYTERAKYYQQVKNYIEIFGHEKVKIIIFERFIKEPKLVCSDLFRFLNVDDSFEPEIMKSNEGGEMRFSWIKWLRNQKYPFLKKLIPLHVRASMRRFTRDINVKKEKQKVRMDLKTRQICNDCFESDINELRSFLGDDIVEWNIR